jgi:hypothetical protein
VAANPATGEYLAVWGDPRNGKLRLVYGQIVDRAGGRVGRNLRITGKSADRGADNPAVVWNPVSGEYLVVWADDRSEGARGRDIYGQRLAADGTRIGWNFRISGKRADDYEDGPAVDIDRATGRYLVVWHDDRAWQSDIYGQILGPSGSRVGNNVKISVSKAAGGDHWPSVAADPAGGSFLVAWRDSRRDEESVFVQQVGADGRRMGSDRRVSGAAAAWPRDPDVAAGPVGTGYLVVWSELRDYRRMLTNIYGQRVRLDGTRRGRNFLVSGTNGKREDEHPTVTWDTGTGRWLVSWWEHEIFACARCVPSGGSEARMLGRLVGPAGKRICGRFTISTSSSDYPRMDPASAWNATAGRHLVVWIDEPMRSTAEEGVFGRTVAW